MSKSSDRAADKWVEELTGRPPNRWDSFGGDPGYQIVMLASAAFSLYAEAWGGHGWRISEWLWPFNGLPGKITGHPRMMWKHSLDWFDGNEPWAVCFKRAIEIAKRHMPAAVLMAAKA